MQFQGFVTFGFHLRAKRSDGLIPEAFKPSYLLPVLVEPIVEPEDHKRAVGEKHIASFLLLTNLLFHLPHERGFSSAKFGFSK